MQGHFPLKQGTLVGLGYDIVPIEPTDKSCVVPGWTGRDFNKANGEYVNHGIGAKTARTPAVDIDVKDPVMAQAMIDYTHQRLGHSPRRIGMAPKTALVYRADEPFKKIASPSYIDRQGVAHKVEILGDGQQLVLFHVHPDTQRDYQWPDGDPLSYQDLPIITRDDALAIVAQFDTLVELLTDWTARGGGTTGQGVINCAPDGIDPFEGLVPAGSRNVTEAQAREAVFRLDPNMYNDHWIKVLMALHSTGQPWAHDLAHEWSSKATRKGEHGGDCYQPALLDKRWDSLGMGTSGVTMAAILDHANKAGFPLLGPSKEAGTPVDLGDPGDPLGPLRALVITADDVKNVEDATFIYERLIVKGHLVTVIGRSGHGKTTIMQHVMAQLPDHLDVFHIFADGTAAQIKDARALGVAGGFSVVGPDLKGGLDEMGKVFDYLANLDDLTNVVLVLDTLKKFANLMKKDGTAEFYKLLRKMTSRGCTVVALGHTNKYDDPEGYPIYEGVGDIRNDTDELLLLYKGPSDLGKGHATVSCYGPPENGELGWEDGKARAMIQPLSWNMEVTATERRVHELPSWVDTVSGHKENEERIQDQVVTTAICHQLVASPGPNQTTLLDRLADEHIAARQARRVLRKYINLYWAIEKGEHGAKCHFITEEGRALVRGKLPGDHVPIGDAEDLL